MLSSSTAIPNTTVTGPQTNFSASQLQDDISTQLNDRIDCEPQDLIEVSWLKVDCKTIRKRDLFVLDFRANETPIFVQVEYIIRHSSDKWLVAGDMLYVDKYLPHYRAFTIKEDVIDCILITPESLRSEAIQHYTVNGLKMAAIRTKLKTTD